MAFAVPRRLVHLHPSDESGLEEAVLVGKGRTSWPVPEEIADAASFVRWAKENLPSVDAVLVHSLEYSWLKIEFLPNAPLSNEFTVHLRQGPPATTSGASDPPALVVLTHVLQKLDALRREGSATRSGSDINADDFELVRKGLKIVGPLNEDKDGNSLSDNTNVLEQLLGNEQFWDERYEEQQRVRYCKTVEGWVASKRFHRCIRWANGNRETVRRKFEGLHFTLSSNNDLVAVLRNFGELFSQGAVLGVELKRKTLTRRSLRQAYLEFFLWADASRVPFVQLITDMQKGGVAIYCKRIDAVTGIELRQVVLRDMDEVKEFLSNMGAALPDDLGDDGPDGLILPQTLSGPPRKKFKQMEEKTERDSGEGRTGYERATKAQIALWTIGPRFLENDGDVANLAELDSFQQELTS